MIKVIYDSNLFYKSDHLADLFFTHNNNAYTTKSDLFTKEEKP